jgi:hypothetical protein
MEKRGRGRPPKPPEDRLTERLDVRADPADKSQFEQAAQLAGMKLSDWIRERLKEAAKAELRRASRPKRKAGVTIPFGAESDPSASL